MARRFTANHYSNCSECEDLIEPGDQAGFVDDVDGALCDNCLIAIDEEDDWSFGLRGDTGQW